MARKDEAKPMLPAKPVDRIQCAADADCRYPGRIWVDGYGAKERLCVEHYYAWLERRNSPHDA